MLSTFLIYLISCIYYIPTLTIVSLPQKQFFNSMLVGLWLACKIISKFTSFPQGIIKDSSYLISSWNLLQSLKKKKKKSMLSTSVLHIQWWTAPTNGGTEWLHTKLTLVGNSRHDWGKKKRKERKWMMNQSSLLRSVLITKIVANIQWFKVNVRHWNTQLKEKKKTWGVWATGVRTEITNTWYCKYCKYHT